MKLLLHTDIPKLGYFGDVVEVKEGYARNYLIPQGLAVVPTEANIQAIEAERAQKAEERRLARERLVKVAEQVDGAAVVIEALTNEIGHLFGSVNEDAVAEALRNAGYEIQSKFVKMREHIRTVGEHEVQLRLAEDVKATVTVKVTGPEGEADESESDTESTETPESAEQPVESEAEQVE